MNVLGCFIYAYLALLALVPRNNGTRHSGRYYMGTKKKTELLLLTTLKIKTVFMPKKRGGQLAASSNRVQRGGFLSHFTLLLLHRPCRRRRQKKSPPLLSSWGFLVINTFCGAGLAMCLAYRLMYITAVVRPRAPVLKVRQ